VSQRVEQDVVRLDANLQFNQWKMKTLSVEFDF